MDKKLLEKWNKCTKKIPFDKDPSNYAVEKEKYFPRNSLILDLGSGQGHDSIYFASKGHKVVLIDISNISLEKAKKIFTKKGFEKKLLESKQVDLNGGKIPMQDSRFDIVYSRLSLHYFTRDILIRLFKEILRVLKRNGVAFITIKSPKDKIEMDFLNENCKEIEPGVFKEKDGQLKTRFSSRQIKSMFSEISSPRYSIKIAKYIEKLSGRIDKIKSGKKEFLLTEITIQKRGS
jgi:ubiquinone/menaquinone biosynthesis C-methylase UbiE